MADSPASAAPALKRSLGLLAVIAFGVGDILGAGVYGLVGRVAGIVGEAAWTAYVLAGITAALTGLAYAELASRYPHAGGAAHYCREAFRNSFITFLVMFFVGLSGLFSMATTSRIFAQYLVADASLPAWVSAAAIPSAYILVIAAIAARGIAATSWTNALCTTVEFVGLAIILALGARFLGSGDYLRFAPEVSPWMAVPAGASLAFFAFIGFEDIVNLSEETKDPERTIPLGICAAVAITSAIYVLIALVAVSVRSAADLAATKTPLMLVVETAAPWFPRDIYRAIPAFAVFNTALLNLVMASRLMYGMARKDNRLLPGAFAYVHPTWHTPLVGIALGVVVAIALVWLVADIGTLANGTTTFLLVVFLLLHVGLLVVKRRPAPTPRFAVPAIVPVLGIGTTVALLAARDPATWLVAGAFAVLGAVLYAINWIARRGHLEVQAVD